MAYNCVKNENYETAASGNRRIFIVEDDLQVRKEMICLLERSGYICMAMESFDHALEQMEACEAELILLDITLPGIDGTVLLREFRKRKNTPVIMVTSRDTEMDEVLCMSYGADDFIAKPYHPSILLLHIEALFKRMHRQEEEILEYGGVRLDMARSCMLVHSSVVELSKNELKILCYLMKNCGRIVSRDELISYLWDTEEFIDDNTLTVNLSRVRKKLEEQGIVDMIKTKRGQGYLIG